MPAGTLRPKLMAVPLEPLWCEDTDGQPVALHQADVVRAPGLVVIMYILPKTSRLAGNNVRHTSGCEVSGTEPGHCVRPASRGMRYTRAIFQTVPCALWMHGDMGGSLGPWMMNR